MRTLVSLPSAGRALPLALGLLLTAALAAGPARADDEADAKRKRNKVALIPMKCERDIEPELCSVLAESMAMSVSKAPGLEVVTPADLEVLMGAQALAELSSCGGEACFVGAEMLRIDAAWLLAGRITRVGQRARLVLRLVDLERGAIIDREEATPTLDETEMDTSIRRLAVRLMARRGLLSLEQVEGQPLAGVVTQPLEEEGPGAVFYVGVGTSAVGGLALLGAGALGTVAFFGVENAKNVERSGGDRQVVLEQARQARTYAYGSDLLLVAGGALVVTGLVMTATEAF